MIDYQPFFDHIAKTQLKPHQESLYAALQQRLNARSYGDLAEWQEAIDSLPSLQQLAPVTANLDQDLVSLHSNATIDSKAVRDCLMKLHPWRKGPFDIFGIHIDTEWRSDMKWQRLQPHIASLENRTVLDVGCGSGYHCWRMRGAGAKFVLGIEPSPKFLMQFAVFKRYLPEQAVYLLPLLSEDMPASMQCFDSVFSMGVLYHRKSPIEHLEELKQALRPGGELILETLVVDGDATRCLVPGERYAQMRNVWFLPSTDMLEQWLERLGFINIRTVDINQTSEQEQRATDWMQFHSLSNYLDPEDTDLTVEGYPAPKRAIIIANRK